MCNVPFLGIPKGKFRDKYYFFGDVRTFIFFLLFFIYVILNCLLHQGPMIKKCTRKYEETIQSLSCIAFIHLGFIVERLNSDFWFRSFVESSNAFFDENNLEKCYRIEPRSLHLSRSSKNLS